MKTMKTLVMLLAVITASPCTYALVTDTKSASGVHSAKSQSPQSIKQTMKLMKLAYRKANKSETITEFAMHVAELKRLTQQAAMVNYDGTSSEKKVYTKGVEQLISQFAELDKAVAMKDLAMAKQVLQKIKSTEKKYHSQLDV